MDQPVIDWRESFYAAQLAGPIMAAMDKQFGDWIWNQPGNYRERGL